MEWLWWTLGGVCGGLLLLVIVFIVVVNLYENRKFTQVMKTGDKTVGWLVQAHKNIFDQGVLDEAGVVLISPDRDTAQDREFMMDMADQVFALKGEDPDELPDADNAFVAALMADETYVEGKKDQLPKTFARGRIVYLAHIMIYRDHLPGKKLSGRRVACVVVWENDQLPICSRPMSAKDYRRQDDES